jgi:exodeoxyribonuclease V alpha subunit
MAVEKVRLLDRQFSRFLAKHSLLSGTKNKIFQELVCKLSATLARGDSCLPLLPGEVDLVLRSGLSGENQLPLYIFDDLLYLQRFFQYEKQMSVRICEMLAEPTVLKKDVSFVERLFAGQERRDLQRVAAEQALQNNFLIISGGPGTGKTTTVVKILALLQHASSVSLRISVAAPTGKAAMRLQESISGNIKNLPVSETEKSKLAVKPSTLHRLLGVKRNSPFFRHNSDNPLPCDVLVVDEASMVDLALMSKLVNALRQDCRLILLGDKNQLASVESGTVLADIMTALPSNTVELKKSYRFDQGIKKFAEAINEGSKKEAWQLVSDTQPEHISLLQEELSAYCGSRFLPYIKAVFKAKSKEEYKKLFSLLGSFKILCAVRQGESGVVGINRTVEQYLTTKGYDCLASEWYPGRPVMISKNEYSLDLYNGDIGICLPDPARPERMKVWFEQNDGELLGILPGRIGNCETVYALTIHKSQGTEVENVLVVLPEKETALVSRELLYTAVTRASKSVAVAAGKTVFQAAVGAPIRRSSGLAKMINILCVDAQVE